MTLLRAFLFGFVVCLASLVGLVIGAGNVGLQQSLRLDPFGFRLDPVGFAADYPMAVILCLGAAFVAALIFVRTTRAVRSFVPLGVLAVVAGDVLTSFVVAPLMVGELEPAHGFTVLVAVSLFGLQIVAAAAGAWVGARGARPVAA